jgi:hypothetical protein
VIEVGQDLKALADDIVALAVFDIGNEADTAAIMFVLAVVQALLHISFHRSRFNNAFDCLGRRIPLRPPGRRSLSAGHRQLNPRS